MRSRGREDKEGTGDVCEWEADQVRDEGREERASLVARTGDSWRKTGKSVLALLLAKASLCSHPVSLDEEPLGKPTHADHR